MRGFQRLPRLNPCLPCVVANPDQVFANPDPSADSLRQQAMRYRALGDLRLARRFEALAREIERDHRNPGYGTAALAAGAGYLLGASALGDVAGTLSRAAAKRAARKIEGEHKNPPDRSRVRAAEMRDEVLRAEILIAAAMRETGRRRAELLAEAVARLDRAKRKNPDARRARPSDLPINKVVTTCQTRTERVPAAKKNPKLMVLNPSGDPFAAEVERRIGRHLSATERSQLSAARREFRTFHGREAGPRDLVPVDAPPGLPLFLSYVGHETRHDYDVRIDSERRGKWTHAAGDHGRKHRTPPGIIASVPGRKKHNTVLVAPRGADPHFKATHGLMG